MSPFVSCVCPTKASRSAWLVRAINCFVAQTYQGEIELLIVGDAGEPLSVPDIPKVRVIQAPAGLVLGAKRNFACRNAAGTIIAHWDDDDWSAPGRIEQQIARLEQTGLALTGYSLMKFTNGTHWWQYIGDKTWPLGTSLCYLKSWWEKNPFPDIRVASDTSFTSVARAGRQADSIPCGDMMYATVHPENTSPRYLSVPSSFRKVEPAEVLCFA